MERFNWSGASNGKGQSVKLRRLKLSMAGSEDQWKLLCVGKGLPCLQIRGESVTKALRPPLDVLSRNAKFPQFSGPFRATEQRAAFASR